MQERGDEKGFDNDKSYILTVLHVTVALQGRRLIISKSCISSVVPFPLLSFLSYFLGISKCAVVHAPIRNLQTIGLFEPLRSEYWRS